MKDNVFKSSCFLYIMGVNNKKPKSLLKDIFSDDEIKRAKKIEPSKDIPNSKTSSSKSEATVKNNKFKEESLKEYKSKQDKPKKIKLSVLAKKERREHIMVMILTAFIVLLLMGLGYSVYTYYQTKVNTHEEISSLNNTILNLSEDKNQLILNLGNLTNELDTLNKTVKSLTSEKVVLTAEIISLNSEIDDLQSDLDELQGELDSCEDTLDDCEIDLEDCEDACP